MRDKYQRQVKLLKRVCIRMICKYQWHNEYKDCHLTRQSFGFFYG